MRAKAERPAFTSSSKAAAKFLGIEPSQARLAKEAACPAFRSGRIYLDELAEYIAETCAEGIPPLDDSEQLESKEILERRRMLAQVRIYQHKLEVEKRAVISIDEHNRAMTKAAHAARTVIMEWKPTAPTWSGLTPAEIDTQVDAFIDRVCGALSDAGSAVYS